MDPAAATTETEIDETNTDNEQEETSLRDILADAYDAAEATANDDTPDSDDDAGQDAETAEAGAKGGDPEADADSGGSDKDTADTAADQDAKSDETDKAAEPSDTTYPEHWDPSFKEGFEALDANGQKFLLDRAKAMEADYTRKRQADAAVIEAYAPVDEIMSPFKQLMAEQKMAPAELIRRWAVAENHLNTNPYATIRALAEHYNVDLVDLAYGVEGDQGQQQQRPNNDSMQQQQPMQDPRVDQMLATQARSEMDAFADQTDESGNPVHPYFDDVIGDMMQILEYSRWQGARSANPAAYKDPTWEELYERACQTNTSVAAKIQETQHNAVSQDQRKAAEQAAAEATKEARLKAEQARKAGKSIDGDPGSGGTAEQRPQHKTVGAAVRAAFDLHS